MLARTSGLCVLLLAASSVHAAGPGSVYAAIPADIHVPATTQTTLLSRYVEVAGDSWLYVHSDGRYGPLGSSIADVYITIDRVKVSSDAVIDWRGSASAQQHSFEVLGAVVVPAGRHLVSLMGEGLDANSPFYVGAGTNLTVLTRPADRVFAARTTADLGPYNFTSMNVVPNPHGPLVSASFDPAGAPVVLLAAGNEFQNGHSGDGILGLYVDGSNGGNGTSLWSMNDLWSGAEVRAPLFTHGYYSGLAGTHVFSLDAAEARWLPSQNENPAVFDVGANTRLVALSGGMAVSGSGATSNVFDSTTDYVCVGSSSGWPGCPPAGTPQLLADAWLTVPTTHNGVVTLLGKSRVQGDPADAGGTIELYLTLDGAQVGDIGVQQEASPNGVSERTIAASYSAAGAQALAPGPHHAQLWGMITSNSSFVHLAMVKDLPLVWFDGSDGTEALAASFELGLGGWTTWANCGSDSNWSVTQYYTKTDYPAPGGGSYALRLHSTGFTGGSCQYPGVYALSPSVPAFPGTTYAVDSMSRNASNVGQTQLIFYDEAGHELSVTPSAWSSDAWQYGADPTLTVTAPPGTARLAVRYALLSANAYADVDLLSVRAASAAETYYDSFEAGIGQWTTWSNCDAGGAAVFQYDTANDHPAPLGGRYALRLHTAAFVGNGCVYPGTYALGPAITAAPGVTYAVDHMSRNAGFAGETMLLFFDSGGHQLAATAVPWSSDAWQYHASPTVSATAPPGTASLRVRFDLFSADAWTDLDLVHVRAR